MSKVITTELQHAGASGANITLDSSKNVTCENNLTVDGATTLTGAVTLPDDTVTSAKIADNAITNALMADDAIGVAELSATGTASASTFLRGDNSWAAAGGGKIIKVWHTGTGGGEGIGGTVHSSTYVKKGWIDITPTSASNKILIVAKYNAHFRNQQNNENGNHYYTKLVRTSAWDDTSSPVDGEVLFGGIWAKDTGMELVGGSAVHWWLDAPATTDNRRYAFYAKCNSTDWKIYLSYLSTNQDIFAFEIADIVDAPPD